ncbi:hypothetical protein AAZX31_15G248300 [Glycine max]
MKYLTMIHKMECLFLQPSTAWAGILDKARHGGMHKRGPN